MKFLKSKYEEVSVEIISLYASDIITASGSFDTEDDDVSDWGNK